MPLVDVSDRARSDFLALVEYLYAPRARELIAAYTGMVDALREHPELGTLQTDGRTRVLRRGGYRFYYTFNADRVYVLRIADPRGPDGT